MKWRKKGSLTVEAAVVLSLSVITAGWMLSLGFHVYQRCWYTQAACETVLTGSFEGILKGRNPKEKAGEKWKMRKNEFFMVPEKLTYVPSGNKNQVSCKITGETFMWRKNALPFEIHVSQKVIRPVEFIRKVEMVTEGGK